MNRWLIALAGVAALVVLFLLFRPDAEPSPTSNPTPTATSVTLEPTGSSSPEPTDPTPSPTVTLDAVEIEVEEGRVEGPGQISVTQGDRVAIEVKADTADHVHVHGYDLMADVAPDREVTITFRADIPGIFEIELEDAGLLLTRLEVTP
jgi:FtsP/CotA-like multicopper oxidase with cupredoxin domain